MIVHPILSASVGVTVHSVGIDSCDENDSQVHHIRVSCKQHGHAEAPTTRRFAM
jgi:hypothetical protein